MFRHRAAEAKETAIDRALRAADAAWVAMAEMSILRVAHREPTFTTDEVWQELETLGPAGQPEEPRALGAVLHKMAKQGTILPLDEYRPSLRRVCHGRPVRIWRKA